MGSSAFGVVAAFAGYAAAEPAKLPPDGPPQNSARALPTEAKRLKDAETRLAAHHARIIELEAKLAARTLRVANLPKPPPSTAPFCASDTVSKNPQGGTQNCAPYLCNHASGNCRPSTCNSIDDCAQPNICSDEGHRLPASAFD